MAMTDTEMILRRIAWIQVRTLLGRASVWYGPRRLLGVTRPFINRSIVQV
jgi:hypothetical protein